MQRDRGDCSARFTIHVQADLSACLPNHAGLTSARYPISQIVPGGMGAGGLPDKGERPKASPSMHTRAMRLTPEVRQVLPIGSGMHRGYRIWG